MQPLVLIDLDDVLSQTNAAAAQWHNKLYGTNMTLDDFHYYHWWKNPGWGDQSQTASKAQLFYASSEFFDLAPVPDAIEAVRALKAMAFRLAILTTRGLELHEQTIAWTNKWFPDVFENIHFTGNFTMCGGDPHQENVTTQLSKGEICGKLAASLIIDDSVENVLDCANASTGQTPALLFGDYEWGKRASTTHRTEDLMNYERRQQHELAQNRNPEWWQRDIIDLPERVWRVKDWPAVQLWLRQSGHRI